MHNHGVCDRPVWTVWWHLPCGWHRCRKETQLKLFGRHQADWEHVTLRVSNVSPVGKLMGAILSQHVRASVETVTVAWHCGMAVLCCNRCLLGSRDVRRAVCLVSLTGSVRLPFPSPTPPPHTPPHTLQDSEAWVPASALPQPIKVYSALNSHAMYPGLGNNRSNAVRFTVSCL